MFLPFIYNVIQLELVANLYLSAGPPCDSILLCDGDVTYDTIYPYPAGSSANVSCDMGYTLSGSDNLTCYFNISSVSSYWIPEVPTCES